MQRSDCKSMACLHTPGQAAAAQIFSDLLGKVKRLCDLTTEEHACLWQALSPHEGWIPGWAKETYTIPSPQLSSSDSEDVQEVPPVAKGKKIGPFQKLATAHALGLPVKGFTPVRKATRSILSDEPRKRKRLPDPEFLRQSRSSESSEQEAECSE